jgi:hypothetical protein
MPTIRGGHWKIQKKSRAGDKAVTNYLPHGEFRDTNTSAVYAIYRILRRQPWKAMAITTWGTMKRFRHLALIATSLGALLPPTLVQARSYEVLSTNVPFKFQVGERTFNPGEYDFIVVGPGLLAMRDSQHQVVASLNTRARTFLQQAPVSKLVFDSSKKDSRLIQIWIASRSQVLDVVKEETATRPATAAPTSNAFEPGFGFLMERPSAPGFKH